MAPSGNLQLDGSLSRRCSSRSMARPSTSSGKGSRTPLGRAVGRDDARRARRRPDRHRDPRGRREHLRTRNPARPMWVAPASSADVADGDHRRHRAATYKCAGGAGVTAVSSSVLEAMYIDGAWTTGTGTGSREIRSPFSGELLAVVPEATEADVDAAVSSAVRAFGENPLTPFERYEILLTTARLIQRASRGLCAADRRRSRQADPRRSRRGRPRRADDHAMRRGSQATRWRGRPDGRDARIRASRGAHAQHPDRPGLRDLSLQHAR